MNKTLTRLLKSTKPLKMVQQDPEGENTTDDVLLNDRVPHKEHHEIIAGLPRREIFLSEAHLQIIKDRISEKIKALDQSLSKHYGNIPEGESEQIHTYTKNSSTYNTFLHENKGNIDNIKKRHTPLIQSIDKTLNSNKTPHRLTVYSGIERKYSPLNMKPAKDGNIHVIHHGYLSTSIRPRVADNFSPRSSFDNGNSENHILKIHVPSGHQGAYINHLSKYGGRGTQPSESHEHEYLLPRGSRLQINPKPKIQTRKIKMPGQSSVFLHHTHIWTAHIKPHKLPSRKQIKESKIIELILKVMKNKEGREITPDQDDIVHHPIQAGISREKSIDQDDIVHHPIQAGIGKRNKKIV